MSFHNDKEERNAVPPVLGRQGPAFRKSGAFGKPPGFLKAAGGIMERIKGLSRRDLGLVALGLSALVMAPVAEYMMSRPPMDNALAAGFGSRGMGDVSSIYEPGIHGLSQGSPDGSGEVITPLSARDPASLILGAAKPAPPPMPSAPPGGSLRDTVRDAGREAFSAAVKAGGAPAVIPKMQSGLRGMASFFGGGESSRTSGSLSGGQISADAKKASGKSASRSMVGPVASAGYKGVAMTPNSASRGAFEKLRAQAGAAADNFTTGSAVRGLDKAAAASVNAGAGDGGLGGGKDGDKTKSPSNSSARDQKSHSPKESLAEMLNRKRAEKALEWEFYKKYEIPKKIIEAVLSGVGSSLTAFSKSLTDGVTGQGGGPAPTVYYCYVKCADATDINTCNELEQTTDPKIVDGWYKYNTCQRVSSKGQSSGGGGANGGTGNMDTDSPNPPTGIPQAAVDALENELDPQLKEMADAVVAGQAAEDSRSLLKNTNKAAAGVMACSDSYRIRHAAPFLKQAAVLQGEVLTYKGSISRASSKANGAMGKMDKFQAGLSGVMQQYEDGTLKTASNGQYKVVASGNVTLENALKRIKSEAEGAGLDVDGAIQNLEYHRKAAQLYDTQVRKAMTNAQAMNAFSIEAYNQAKTLKEGDLAALSGKVRSNSLTRDEEIQLIDIFKTLTGRDTTFQPQPAPAADTSSLSGKTLLAMAFPADLRDAAGDVTGSEGGGYTGGLVNFRGMDTARFWESREIDDSRVKEAETTLWREISPRHKLDVPDYDPAANAERDLPQEIISMGMRLHLELPWDIASMKDAPAIEEIRVDVDARIAEWKRELKDDHGIVLGDTTGGPPPPPNPIVAPAPDGGQGGGAPPVAAPGPGTPAGDPTPGVTNSATRQADDLLGLYSPAVTNAQVRYDAIYAGRANCTSRTCKQNLKTADTQLKRMKTLKSEVSALREQAVQPGADVAVIERQLGDKRRALEDAHTRFNAAATIVEQREAIPSGSPDSGAPGGNPDGDTAAQPEPAECYKRGSGCSTVSAFYLVQSWTPISPSAFAGIYTGSGVIGRANDRIYDKYRGKNLSTAQRDQVCETEIGGFGEGVLSLLNAHTLGTARSDCKKKFFTPGYSLGFNRSGNTSSGGDIVRMVASRTNDGASSKGYYGEAQSNYNVAFELLCSKNASNLWQVNTVSLRVDKPVTYTESVGFTLGVRAEAVNAGITMTSATGRSVPYGEWKRAAYSGGICGSQADGK